MSQINFRAWDKNVNKMKLVECIYFDDDGISMVAVQSKRGVLSLHKINDIDVILMQYTGLKDKNGKEIYEGDILEPGWAEGEVFEVVYDETHARFCEKRSGKEFLMDGSLMRSKHDARKIIGNIHENPELLEADNG